MQVMKTVLMRVKENNLIKSQFANNNIIKFNYEKLVR